MTQPKTRQDWLQRANSLSIRHQAFIDGRYVDAASGKTFDCISPIDGRVLAKVAECGAEDVDRAVKVARRAFEDGKWANARPTHRKKVLVKLAQLIHEHGEELALLESLDMGKPVSDALSVDVAASVRCMAWTGEAIDTGIANGELVVDAAFSPLQEVAYLVDSPDADDLLVLRTCQPGSGACADVVPLPRDGVALLAGQP